jgi:hypothetical protein
VHRRDRYDITDTQDLRDATLSVEKSRKMQKKTVIALKGGQRAGQSPRFNIKGSQLNSGSHQYHADDGALGYSYNRWAITSQGQELHVFHEMP